MTEPPLSQPFRIRALFYEMCVISLKRFAQYHEGSALEMTDDQDASEMVPALPPMAWTIFTQSRPPARSDILAIINRAVNHAIDPPPQQARLEDPWKIGPGVGWCHDYAVTKRWLLLALRFKASELLLCECIAPDDQHHLVLRVGDVVLDNLTDAIGPMRIRWCVSSRSRIRISGNAPAIRRDPSIQEVLKNEGLAETEGFEPSIGLYKPITV